MNQSGFSLLELLIVVTVVSCLVAAAVPVFCDSLARTQEVVEMVNNSYGFAVSGG